MTDSVGPTPHFRNVPHVTAIGYLIVAVLAIVLLPLLPFLAVFWLVGRKVSPEEPEPELT